MLSNIRFWISQTASAGRLLAAFGLLGISAFLSACTILPTSDSELRSCNNAAVLRSSGLKPMRRSGPMWSRVQGRTHKSVVIFGQKDKYLIAAVSPRVTSLKLTGATGAVVPPTSSCVYQQLEPQKSYYFETTLESSGTYPSGEIALFEVMSPPAVQTEIDAIYKKSTQSSPWYRGDPISTLGEMADDIVDALGHARALSKLNLAAEPDEERAAKAFANAADHVLGLEKKPESARRVANIARTLGDEAAAGGYDALRETAGCLSARLLAESLADRALALENRPVMRVAEQIDEIVSQLNTDGEDNLACDEVSCPGFPRLPMSRAVERMVELAIKYAREDLCGQENDHKRRLAELIDLLNSLAARCWIDSPTTSRPLKQMLESTIVEIRQAVEWQLAQIDDLEGISGQLERLSFQMAAALGDRDDVRLGQLNEELRGVDIPELTPPEIGRRCYEVSSDLAQQHRKLTDLRRELSTIREWYERFQRSTWVRYGRLPSCDELGNAQTLAPTRQEIVCDQLKDLADSAVRNPDCAAFQSIDSLFRCTATYCSGFRDRLVGTAESCREELAVDNLRQFLINKSEEGTCSACQDMERRVRGLQSGAPYERNATERLDPTFRQLLAEAGRRVLEDQSPASSCYDDDLDPRPRGLRECCGLDASTLNNFVDRRKQQCCVTVLAALQAKLDQQAARIASLARLEQMSWSEFRSAVNDIEDALSMAPDRSHQGCDVSQLSGAITRARNAWRDRLYGDDGIFVSLFDSLAENRSQFSDRPSSSTIVEWAADFALSHDNQARNWHRMLEIAWLVGRVVEDCPQGDARPTENTLRTYEHLKREKERLAREVPQALREQAEIAIGDAESCMAPFDRRILTVRFDSQCRYREQISTQNYDITERGRLIKLEFDTSQVQGTELRDVSSLIVEFHAEGYAVSARNSDGSRSTDEARMGTLEGDDVENLQGYRFHERITGQVYYRIDPIGSSAGRELYLRVVPRPF